MFYSAILSLCINYKVVLCRYNRYNNLIAKACKKLVGKPVDLNINKYYDMY